MQTAVLQSAVVQQVVSARIQRWLRLVFYLKVKEAFKNYAFQDKNNHLSPIFTLLCHCHKLLLLLFSFIKPKRGIFEVGRALTHFCKFKQGSTVHISLKFPNS